MATNKLIDIDKYKAAFIYLLEKIGKIEGKKKAYKLLYFLDFDYFEAYDKPFIGETYKALPMGPAPSYFDCLALELKREGYIDIEKKKWSEKYENETVIYKPKREMKYSFTTEEKKMLDRIVDLYGKRTGKQLEDLSHCQAPFKAVKQGDIIPYEFSMYRDTPDLI
jgi:uncharacterized phage-associated protein